MQFNGSGLHSDEATREHLAQGIVDGKGTAVLNDNLVEFAQGCALLNPQHLQGQLAHDVA